MTCLLGIDVGTTNIKAIVFDERGQAVARASEPTPTVHEGMGRAVHHAGELWETVTNLVCRLTGSPDGEVAGVAVASMGEEGFVLDSSGQVLAPGILWWDDRTLEQVDWWREHVGAERIYHETGLPISQTFSALKLQWLYRHEREMMRHAKHWLGVSEYIAYRLSGVIATTPSLASRTLLYDLENNRWSEEFLDLAGIPADMMPPIMPSGSVIGRVTDDAAAATGLRPGTPVAGGGHDHICGFLAAGAVSPGAMVHSGGTAEAIAHIIDRDALIAFMAGSSEIASGAHVVPGLYYQERGRQSGAVIQWWIGLLAGDRGREALFAEAAASPQGANGLVFVPYMFGKAAPDADPAATGSLLGLTADHTRGDVMRAVLEGVAFDTISLQRLLRPEPGDTVRAIGGLAYNDLWLQLKANIMNLRVEVPEQPEAVAQGAALLAGLGVGVYSDAASIPSETLRLARVVEPSPDLVSRYETLYQERYLPAAKRAQRIVGRTTRDT